MILHLMYCGIISLYIQQQDSEVSQQQLRMSIYSGFATRFQQQSYDHCIDSLLYIMQKRIIKFYQNQQADQEKFISLVLKLFQQMRNMEKNKYLQPKSSHSIHELIKFMQIYEQNIVANPPGQKEERGILPQIEHKTPFSENGIDKKKSPFWVQKREAQKQGNVGDNIENKQKSMTINNEPHSEMRNIQSKGSFRKTSYHKNLRGIHVKNSSNSKSKLEQYKIVKQPSKAPMEIPKNRSSKSNYLQQKPNILQSKVTYYAGSAVGDQHSFQRKRKVRSNAKIANNQTDTQQNQNSNQVADIIKQYILKARKNYMRGTRTKELREGGGRINDF